MEVSDYVILTKLGQHVNGMMAVAVKNVLNLNLVVTFSYNQTKRSILLYGLTSMRTMIQ